LSRRILAARQPVWSEDGSRVVVGVAAWNGKPGTKDEDADEPASVDVWHWKDPVVVPRQKSLLPATRTASVAAAWNLADGRLTMLAIDPLEDVRPIKHRPATALVVDRKAYAMERSIGRIYADVYTVDLASGARTKIKDRIEDEYVQASPGGRYVLYLIDDHYSDGRLEYRRPGQHHQGDCDLVRRQASRTIPSSRSRRLAWPAGRKTTAPCGSTTSWISGRCRPDGTKSNRLT
jgi:hypothetical protein